MPVATEKREFLALRRRETYIAKVIGDVLET
jgi:hypothetical protein